MEDQILKLKKELKNLVSWGNVLRETCISEKDYMEEQKIDKKINGIRAKLFQLTGDYKYATVEAVVKHYRRPYWDYREYGAISLTELYKRKQAKIELIKRRHKQRGITHLTVDMKNIHTFHVEKEVIEAYLMNRRNKKMPLNRRKRQFNMLMHEMWTYAFYFDCSDRFEEVRELVRKVFGSNKKAEDAKLNEIRKVIKLTKMLREML
ncbi:hypothetical protein QUF79_06090 [Fictibacillus enclensis]|uniref:hypothetical protein n=1 Tax=Fictibacillus enclensis TaxID=1017270 RepID=UPI0025A2DE8B|nr:hypothetical protein [Fictibacillus enclensis]MDM5197585.1 hypothetical protein [Fictibacillus enclensis]